MSSTRMSSPRSEMKSPSPPQLSPNSKVQAMLATLDKESDDEIFSGSARARVASAFSKLDTNVKKLAETTHCGQRTDAADAGPGNEEQEDGEEEDIFIPKGRLASRMRGYDKSSEEDVPGPTNAQLRLRSLSGESNSPLASKALEEGDSDQSNNSVLSRKRKFTSPRGPKKAPGSPSLFVSPTRTRLETHDHDTSDLEDFPEILSKSDRFKALVERRRRDFAAREAEVQEEKFRKAEQRRKQAEFFENDNDMTLSDDNEGRLLTQQARPTRKASKRALQEMHRETQRLSRNQQLAHNTVTTKKYPKAELFARFQYRTAPFPQEFEESRRPQSSSPPRSNSDEEMKDTPPTSPATHLSGLKTVDLIETLADTAIGIQDVEEELQTLDEALFKIPSSPPTRADKGKGKAAEHIILEPESPGELQPTKRRVRIRPTKVTYREASIQSGSDSDLEIEAAKTPCIKTKLDSIFDRVPAKKAQTSSSLHALRVLAHLSSPGKQKLGKNIKPSMTASELQVSLQQRARQQANREREERIEASKAKGVYVPTAEERQKEMAEFEDIIEKARKEGEKIMRREKAEAKKERQENGEADPLGDDSSDDEDYEEQKHGVAYDLSVSGSEEDDERSGSDDETALEEGEEELTVEAGNPVKNVLNLMLDDEASEIDDDAAIADKLSISQNIADDDDVDEADDNLPKKQRIRRIRMSNVIFDDEDDEEVDQKHSPKAEKTTSPVQVNTDSPVAPSSVLRSATKTFIPGITVNGPVGLGLTQIFAGTMDESQPDSLQAQSQYQQQVAGQASMAFLKRLPVPTLPPFIPTFEDTQEYGDDPSQFSHVPESQPTQPESPAIQLTFSQSQVHGFDSLIDDTTMSPFPEATQDVGFQHMTPITGRFIDPPPSTVDTLIIDPMAVPETSEETPIVKKRGKLRRRALLSSFSDEEATTQHVDIDEDESDINESIFDVMRKASKKSKVVDEYDKKNSKAKDMVNEQADESEDEYAGLGGASDDESGGEADDYVKEMIDDAGGVKVDERKLAAFFANRERASDEKQVEKLYKDITNGTLRRKRGADYDLSDSDDGGEARRRMKRKENTKLRKAILAATEHIGKIAENPKTQSFLRAIEDRGSEDEIDFLEDFQEQEDQTESQSQSQSQAHRQEEVIPNSQPTLMGPPKRKRSDNFEESGTRLPPHLRRTKLAKKPSNISEIRESVSSLIEEPNAANFADDLDSESERELEVEGEDDLSLGRGKDKENHDPFALRRDKVAVVDRISEKRASAHALSNSTRPAFAASSAAPGFKAPPLLRRATTNNSIASSTSSGVSSSISATERMAGAGGSDGVKRGGAKTSGVNFFARENERRAQIIKTERRREQKRFQGAKVRRKAVGGLLGAGKFE